MTALPRCGNGPSLAQGLVDLRVQFGIDTSTDSP